MSWTSIWVLWTGWLKPPGWLLEGGKVSKGKGARWPGWAECFRFKHLLTVPARLPHTCLYWFFLSSTEDSEDEEEIVHMGNAIMSFYSALIDLLGRCAPEMHVSTWVLRVQLWRAWSESPVDFLNVISSSVSGTCWHAFLSVPFSSHEK